MLDFINYVGHSFAAGFVVGGIIVFLIAISTIKRYFANKIREPKQPNLCPHGYEDWSDCPDCCH